MPPRPLHQQGAGVEVDKSGPTSARPVPSRGWGCGRGQRSDIGQILVGVRSVTAHLTGNDVRAVIHLLDVSVSEG